MYVEEAKCPYSKSCKGYIGGIACLDYNWTEMDCFKEKKEKSDSIKEILKKTL